MANGWYSRGGVGYGCRPMGHGDIQLSREREGDSPSRHRYLLLEHESI